MAATAAVLADDRAATLPDIAKAANVGRATLHRHFTDRDTLVRAAIQDAVPVPQGLPAAARQPSLNLTIRRLTVRRRSTAKYNTHLPPLTTRHESTSVGVTQNRVPRYGTAALHRT
ncbi:TetR/AcrR family transcriptional regulator [Mycolicibacterium sp. CBMA 234]|uniref:TetR/AcrR family transcriptional regulator n=1 Tax=Mycolicibacterium sp. CBMA 234 TaxID=1918495 RepID=UPI0012DE417D|nr:helix-turn-helix domain-containing protein [Mycolicibacterium sp. CBMA 234]